MNSKMRLPFFRNMSKALNQCYVSTNSVIPSNVTDSQKQLLAEQCILVDENDKKLGSASKLKCHAIGSDGSPPPLHRAFSVFLFNSSGSLLLQQRSETKITFPNHYTNTCCSHPLWREEEMDETDAKGVKVAARRRLFSELGIDPEKIDLNEFKYLTRIHYASPSGDGWGEHEIDYILFLKKDLEIQPNPDEVRAVKYVSLSDYDSFLASLQRQEVPTTPWFDFISQNFLKKWWEGLDNLDQFSDHSTIHRHN